MPQLKPPRIETQALMFEFLHNCAIGQDLNAIEPYMSSFFPTVPGGFCPDRLAERKELIVGFESHAFAPPSPFKSPLLPLTNPQFLQTVLIRSATTSPVSSPVILAKDNREEKLSSKAAAWVKEKIGNINFLAWTKSEKRYCLALFTQFDANLPIWKRRYTNAKIAEGMVNHAGRACSEKMVEYFLMSVMFEKRMEISPVVFFAWYEQNDLGGGDCGVPRQGIMDFLAYLIGLYWD
ncbi:MAG: hypothetical protein MMC33_008522 [Icmadophila ericetorum]|nr:hypothetical protein [Icmadophila ericetorum]